MKLLTESLKTDANQLLGLMLINHTTVRYVNRAHRYIYTQSSFDPETSTFTTRQSKTRSFENMLISYFQRKKPNVNMEKFYTTGRQKKIDCFSVDGFCSPSNTVFETMGCFYQFCACKEVPRLLTEKDIQRGSEKSALKELRRNYIPEKGSTVVETWEYEWWRLHKTSNNIGKNIQDSFSNRYLLAAEELLE